MHTFSEAIRFLYMAYLNFIYHFFLPSPLPSDSWTAFSLTRDVFSCFLCPPFTFLSICTLPYMRHQTVFKIVCLVYLTQHCTFQIHLFSYKCFECFLLCSQAIFYYIYLTLTKIHLCGDECTAGSGFGYYELCCYKHQYACIVVIWWLSSLGKISRREIAGHMKFLILIFWETSILISVTIVSIYIPIKNIGGFLYHWSHASICSRWHPLFWCKKES